MFKLGILGLFGAPTQDEAQPSITDFAFYEQDRDVVLAKIKEEFSSDFLEVQDYKLEQENGKTILAVCYRGHGYDMRWWHRELVLGEDFPEDY